jgi:hypothetical protein
LFEGMIVLGIEAQEHPPFFVAGELLQVGLAPGAGEDAGAFDPQHAPLAVAALSSAFNSRWVSRQLRSS